MTGSTSRPWMLEDEDQPAGPALAHRRQHRLGHTQRAEGVELEQLLHLGQRHPLQRRSDGGAGVADQHIDLPGGFHCAIDAVLVGDVEA
jgi:hypothetical protein